MGEEYAPPKSLSLYESLLSLSLSGKLHNSCPVFLASYALISPSAVATNKVLFVIAGGPHPEAGGRIEEPVQAVVEAINNNIVSIKGVFSAIGALRFNMFLFGTGSCFGVVKGLQRTIL